MLSEFFWTLSSYQIIRNGHFTSRPTWFPFRQSSSRRFLRGAGRPICTW